MEFSELATVSETGMVKETFFSLGRLYKEARKGGKECIFSSSGDYAILIPAFKSDDWKNKQKLFDLVNKQLIDIELPKGLSSYRIIDHYNDSFYWQIIISIWYLQIPIKLRFAILNKNCLV